MGKTHPTGFSDSEINKHLRYSVYIYIALLILEGALRKWLLPSFSEVLLLIRDPLVIATYIWAFIHKKLPTNIYVITGTLLISIMAVSSLTFGHGNLLVTLVGIRTNFLHIPYAFIIGSVLFRKDVIHIGKWWLIGSLAMTVIICLQFYLPQSAWINRSVGGGEGGGFIGAMGRYRPPGTFSFIIGTVQFYTLVAAFLACGLTQHKRYHKLLLVVSSFALIIALPVSISRSLLIACVITFAATFLAICVQKKGIKRALQLIVFGSIAILIANQLPIFNESIQAFSKRWDHAQRVEGGSVYTVISERVLANMTEPFTDSEDIPILGYGLGAGTPGGSKLLHGKRGFSLGESEWDRIVGEYGIMFGGLFCIWRMALCFKLLTLSVKSLKRGNGMPIILLSTAAYNIITGQLGQTTVNGFITIGIGLTIASMRVSKTKPAKARQSVPLETKAPTTAN